MYKFYCLLLAVLATIHQSNGKLEVPEVTFEVLSIGFRVSIPDVGGIQKFAFHGNLNEEMGGRDRGTFYQDILKPNNGRWVFEDKAVNLNPGDEIHYWFLVDYLQGRNKFGYVSSNQQWIVPGFSIET